MGELYKRNIFLINKEFQFKFSFILCSLVFISSLAYPIIVYSIFDLFLSKFNLPVDAIEHTRKEFITYIVIYQIIFTIIVFLIGIFLSHKIAGPLYKIKKYFAEVESGQPFRNINFRNGDYFQDFANDVNEFCQYLEENYQNDFEYIKEVNAYINNISLALPEDKKPVIREITTKLADIESRYRNPEV